MSPQPRNRSRAPMRSVGAKATTPSVESRVSASRRGGAVSRMRKTSLSPGERWEADKAAVLKRFRAMMAKRYADGPENGAESLSKPSAGTGTPDRHENQPGRAGASGNRYRSATTGAAE